ncbi:immunoglobulin-like domain-containing protein [Jeotgalibacillus malaysiensis]|uniref:immunoglobulin-like domain-containing protein n=1 Tax=Jeotgalibacillus malaysiensis TaxID=1508404 RepID=UPI00384DDB19
MKKVFLIFSSCIIIYTILSGCQHLSEKPANELDLKPTSYKNLNTLDGVFMSKKAGTLSPSGMTVLFENQSKKDIVYGADYLLKEKIDGQWYELPVIIEGDYGFTSIGYELPPSSTQEWEVDWTGFYGELEKGEYRLIKSILDFRKAGDYDKYWVSVEFEI